LVREIDMTDLNLNNNTIIIGAGNLGQAVAIGRGIYGEPEDLEKKNYIYIYDIDKKKKNYFKNDKSIRFVENLPDVLKKSKIVILAIKPKDYKVVCKSIKVDIKKSAIIMSLMAGIKISNLKKELFNDAKIVRVMTNINITWNRGISFIYANNKVNNSDKKKIDLFWSLLCLMGSVNWIKSESGIDKFTALTGSGPAYFIYFCECLVKVFKNFGLNDRDANEYVQQLFEATSDHSGQIGFTQTKKKIASKGGTTEQALKILQASNFEKTLEKAIRQAHSKSKNILNKKNE